MLKRKHILICDRETGIRESLKLILGDDYDLTVCSDKQECLSLLNDKDLLILDLARYNLDILKKIKDKNSTLRIILLISYKDMEIIKDAIKVNVADYVVKPFSSKDIRTKVANNL